MYQIEQDLRFSVLNSGLLSVELAEIAGTHPSTIGRFRNGDDLGWVLDGTESGKYRQGYSGDHTGPMMITDEGIGRMRIEPGEDPLLGSEPIIRRQAIPRVALVPIAEWDQWADEHPYGATWDMPDQDGILAKARSLGWSD